VSRFPRVPILIATVAATLGLCASAQGAIVTVGSPLTQSFNVEPINALLTLANAKLPEPGAHVTAPISGTVVRWHILDADGGPFSLRVIHPGSAGSFAGAGTSAAEVPASHALQTYATALPIQAGDLIGLNNGRTTGDHIGLTLVTGTALDVWTPPLADGSSAPAAVQPAGEAAFNAEVQPPPTISAISPASGSVEGGTSVVITGTDFEGASAVTFGAAAAKSFTVNSETQITAVAPPTPKPVSLPIAVTTIAGTATSATTFETTACVVPNLALKKLKAAKKRLKKAGCKIGTVKKLNGVTAKTGRVVNQNPKTGKILAPGSKVSVKLG
jgi:hypothetical protein